jgi:hypothetical protein
VHLIDGGSVELVQLAQLTPDVTSPRVERVSVRVS